MCMATWKKKIHLNLWKLRSRFQCWTLFLILPKWLQASNELLRKYHIYANGRLSFFIHPPRKLGLKNMIDILNLHMKHQTELYSAKPRPALSNCHAHHVQRERKACRSNVSFDSCVLSFVISLKYQATDRIRL